MQLFFQALCEAVSVQNIFFVVLGCFLGLFAGAMPGLSATSMMALLLPVCYRIPAASTMYMLLPLYVAVEYSNAIPAVTLGIPGSPGAIATVFDGHPMSKKGQAGFALKCSIAGSAVGGIIGTLVLIGLARPMTALALKIGPAEYFAIAVFGLGILGCIRADSMFKVLLSAVIGLLLSTVGVDNITGHPRFTFDLDLIIDGIPLIPSVIGFFAIPELIAMVGERGGLEKEISLASKTQAGTQKLGSILVKKWKTHVRGSFIGSFIGLIPGLGANIASLVGYDVERRFSKCPDEFGTGVPEGVIASETANNAVVPSALIPLLTLGIPGSPAAALVAAGLIVAGVVPGPNLFAKDPGIIYAIYIACFLGVCATVGGAYSILPFTSRIIKTPRAFLVPIVTVLAFIGAYSIRKTIFDVHLAIAFGIGSYLLKRAGFSPAAIVLGLILGPIIETNLHRAYILGDGSFSLIYTRPISVGILSVMIIAMLWSLWSAKQQKK